MAKKLKLQEDRQLSKLPALGRAPGIAVAQKSSSSGATNLLKRRVVSKECLPTLRRRRPTPHHVFGDCRLGDLKAKHQEFAMDPGRTPLRGFLAHPLNEITQTTINLRAPCPLSGFPAPESFEARAMPPKDGLRLNHLGHAEQARPKPAASFAAIAIRAMARAEASI
jgi:hypothetical protein